ncbi:BatD family protein [Aquipseudomonas ullengensis]|uniref:BatD family protein n=1 Tax=Aquipseudomonas ullengensis TaxID=2759166 RepID=A0A7W4QBU0_9GAMM|nr:BatD family protein [Pseudomonas ullengensis]MBB2497009.1 BatD family protein [Pseudomonas ullengensis]
MKPLLLALLGLLAFDARAEQPEVRIETSLVPDSTVMVGGTLRLQVDVLVDTWFTAAPQLPDLHIPGAVVTPPGGEAEKLNEKRDGKTFFGLRYSYLISPSQVQDYRIPALPIQATPGPGNTTVAVLSQPLSFSAQQPPGFAANETVLVADDVTFTQQIAYSATPLKVGDSITRTLKLEAAGAQSMLLPAPALEDIDGLKRYPRAPLVSNIDNGRGTVSGGQRSDSVVYIVEQAGHYRLPAIELKYWNSQTSQAQTVSAPAVDFTAAANSTYKAPFSIAADLQALGQQSRLHLSRHWLGLTCLLVLAVLLLYFARPLWARGYSAWGRWQARRQAAWLASAEYAWRQIPAQLAGQSPRLDALYLWARRSSGKTQLRSVFSHGPLAERLLAFLRMRYGTNVPSQDTLLDLRKALPQLHSQVSQGTQAATAPHALQPLNPRQPTTAKDCP